MAVNKKQAPHPLDKIAENWCGWQPGFELPPAVTALCDEMCSNYAAGEGLFYSLAVEDRKAEARRAALLKEIRRLQALERKLKKVHSPSEEVRRDAAIKNIEVKQQELLDSIDAAIKNFEVERQRLLDSMNFVSVDELKQERRKPSLTKREQRELDDFMKLIERSQRPKKAGPGRHHNPNTALILDLETIFRDYYEGASDTDIAGMIHELLLQHNIPSTSAKNIVQKLRNA